MNYLYCMQTSRPADAFKKHAMALTSVVSYVSMAKRAVKLIEAGDYSVRKCFSWAWQHSVNVNVSVSVNHEFI